MAADVDHRKVDEKLSSKLCSQKKSQSERGGTRKGRSAQTADERTPGVWAAEQQAATLYDIP